MDGLTETEHKAGCYQNFMGNNELDKKLIKFYNQSSALPILGDASFINSLTQVKPLTKVPRYSHAYIGIQGLPFASGGYGMKKLCNYFGVHFSRVSRIINSK